MAEAVVEGDAPVLSVEVREVVGEAVWLGVGELEGELERVGEFEGVLDIVGELEGVRVRVQVFVGECDGCGVQVATGVRSPIDMRQLCVEGTKLAWIRKSPVERWRFAVLPSQVL